MTEKESAVSRVKLGICCYCSKPLFDYHTIICIDALKDRAAHLGCWNKSGDFIPPPRRTINRKPFVVRDLEANQKEVSEP